MPVAGLSAATARFRLMIMEFGEFDLVVEGEKLDGVPSWFSNLVQFSYEVCSTRNPASAGSEHFVISLPEIDGGLAAITLGSIAAEVERIEQNSKFEEVSLSQLEVGMRISVESGIAGQQKITGEIKTLLLEDRTPRIEIGNRWIAAKFMKRIFRIPQEAGNPQIFERKKDQSENASCFLDHLAFSSLPIHRALINLRSTSKIIEDEFEWEFSHQSNLSSMKIKDLVRPIKSGQPGSGWSIVLNSSESEELAWSNLKSELMPSELDADISVLCSGTAILAQLESTNSKIVFSVFGRDDRQLAATELAIRQRYEYSNSMNRAVSIEKLGPAVELISFEVPINV
jgi:hypothetical protein